jgi:type II secretory pathway component PulF
VLLIYLCFFLKVGGESGNLEKNLSYLAQHLKKQKEFNTKIRGALLYPSIVLGVASVAGVGLSIFVLPKLIDLFNSLDVELPLSTKILLFAAQTMRDYGVIIVFGFIVLLSAARLAIRTKRVKPLWHKITLSLPIFGTFLQDIQLASCFRNIGTMLAIDEINNNGGIDGKKLELVAFLITA